MQACEELMPFVTLGCHAWLSLLLVTLGCRFDREARMVETLHDARQVGIDAIRSACSVGSTEPVKTTSLVDN